MGRIVCGTWIRFRQASMLRCDLSFHKYVQQLTCIETKLTADRQNGSREWRR